MCLDISESSASVIVRIANVPSGATPRVSFSVGGRSYSALATLSQFAGWQASIPVSGLSAGTPYSFTVTASASGQTDTENVNFTTDELQAIVVSVSRITSRSNSVTARVQADNLLSPTIASWSYRLRGSSAWISAP